MDTFLWHIGTLSTPDFDTDIVAFLSFFFFIFYDDAPLYYDLSCSLYQ